MISRLRTNFLAYITTIILNGVANFALVGILVRHFGQSDYGILALASAILSFSFLLDLGCGITVTRLVATSFSDGRAKCEEELGVAWLVLDLLGLISFMLLALIAIYAGPLFKVDSPHLESFQNVMLITALQSLICFHFSIWNGIAMGFQKHATIHTLNSLSAILRVSLACVVCIYYPSPELVAFTYALVSLFTGITIMAVIRKDIPTLKHPGVCVSRKAAARFLDLGYSSSVGMVAGKVLTEGDRFAVTIMASNVALAQFDVMLSLANFTRHIIYSGSQLISAFARLPAEPRIREELLVAATGICVGSYFCLFAFLLFWGQTIVFWWVGPYFLDSLPVLYLLLAATFVQSFSAPSHFFLVAISDLKAYKRLHYAQIVIKALALLIMFNLYGVVGIAASSALIYLVTESIVVRVAAVSLNNRFSALCWRICKHAAKIAMVPAATIGFCFLVIQEKTIGALFASGVAFAISLGYGISQFGFSKLLQTQLGEFKPLTS